jgi:uncharacterized membrane protein
MFSAANSTLYSIDSVIRVTESATFRIHLANDDNKPHNFNLSYENLPTGYIGDYTFNGKVQKKLLLNSAESIALYFNIKAPANAITGTQMFNIKMTRDDGIQYLIPLSVTINNEYLITISSQQKNLNVTNGKVLSFDIIVQNLGSKDLSNIKLNTDLPFKWLVQDAIPEITRLKAGQSEVVKINVSVPVSQVSGNNKIKITAISNEIKSQMIDINVTVQSSPSYLFWFLGALVITIFITIFIFIKHGRR